MVITTPSFWAAKWGCKMAPFSWSNTPPLPNGNQPTLSPNCPMGVADTLGQGLSGLVFTISSTVKQHNNKNSRFLRLPTAGCSLNSKIIATPCISKQPPLGEHRGREQVQACLCWPSPSAPLPPAPWTRAAARWWWRRSAAAAAPTSDFICSWPLPVSEDKPSLDLF